MSHSHSPAMQYDGHHALWRVVKILFLAGVAVVAIFEHSPALLAVLAALFVLILALSERTKKLETQSASNPQVYSSRLYGDGGSFPSDEPEEQKPVSQPASVLDGGSLEHHRS